MRKPAPMPPIPSNTIAQLAGSGTAVMESVMLFDPNVGTG
jgi:hypothetical protein